MNDIKTLQEQIENLKFALEKEIDERNKIGIVYEKTCKEKAALEKRVDFLSGQIEAYKHCIENVRR